MALETGTYIDSLTETNPTSSDNAAQGDDHLRLIKATLKATFPNLVGAMTATEAQLNSAIVSVAETVKGNSAATDEDTADVSMTDLKNMLGLGASAFEPLNTFAAAAHEHDASYAGLSHTHTASQTVSGEFDPARLPAATISSIGAVEKATTTEMEAGTADKFPDAAKVKSFVDASVAATTTVIEFAVPASGVTASAPHGLSVGNSKNWNVHLECIKDTGIFVIGDQVSPPGNYSGAGLYFGAIPYVTATHAKFFIEANGMRLGHNSGSGIEQGDLYWKVVFTFN